MVDENGFVHLAANSHDFPDHLEFDHPDGRWAIMFLTAGEQGDQETELKIFSRPPAAAA